MIPRKKLTSDWLAGGTLGLFAGLIFNWKDKTPERALGGHLNCQSSNKTMQGCSDERDSKHALPVSQHFQGYVIVKFRKGVGESI